MIFIPSNENENNFSLGSSCLSKQSASFIRLAKFIQTVIIQEEDSKQFLRNISLVRSKYKKNIETSLSIENLIKFHCLSSNHKYFSKHENLNKIFFF